MATYTKPDGSTGIFIPYLELTSSNRKAINSDSVGARAECAKHALAPDRLITDEDATVRSAVAKLGYGCERLCKDDSNIVRIAVFDAGYDRLGFIGDSDRFVREHAASAGWGLDTLLFDKDLRVARACDDYLIENGLTYGEWLEKYPERVHSMKAQADLIRRGIGLAVFMDRYGASVDRDGKTVSFMPGFNRECEVGKALRERLSPASDYDVLVARLNQPTNAYVNSIDVNNVVDWAVAHGKVRGLFELDDVAIQYNLAYKGIGLDRLIFDSDYYIRSAAEEYLDNHSLTIEQWAMTVPYAYRAIPYPDFDYSECDNGMVRYADLPQDLKRCVESEDASIRRETADRGLGLDVLVRDPDEQVRANVAWRGYRCVELARDPSPIVREAVASMGYGFDLLSLDSDDRVKDAVELFLNENDLTLEQWIEAHPALCALPENRAKASCDIKAAKAAQAGRSAASKADTSIRQ